MSAYATIHGLVTYREGEGIPITIPEGPVELDFAPDSVTLSWMDDARTAGLTAIPRDEYERYLREGKIQLMPGSNDGGGGNEADGSDGGNDGGSGDGGGGGGGGD